MTQERKLFEPYKRASLAASYDAIVIGSGIGGLAAAALLAKEGGKKVLVLERHYTVGGFTHVFNRPGYEWDVGVHYIGNLKPGSVLRAIFDEVSDGKLDWADMGEVYDRVIIGNEEYPLPKGGKNLAKLLKERFPGEENAIDRYFQMIKDALSTSLAFHAEKAMPGAIAALAGPFMRRKFLQYSDRTVREVLEELTQNQKLIGVLSAQFGDYGSPPAEASFMVHAMVADHYFEGGYYPVGGSGRIHETIIPVIQSAGGQVLINAEVKEVVVEHGRCTGVKMFDDKIIKAPLVISDAGVVNTFASLVPAPVAKKLGLVEKLKKVRPSPAHLCLYIGLKHSPEDLKLPKSNFWIYPDEHHEKNLAAQKQGPGAPLPVLYVSFPAAKDPSFGERFPGRSTIDIITVAPYEWFSKWEGTRWKKRGEDYDALKARLTEQMLDKLYEHVPQVKGKIDVAELSTPLTTKHFCNYQTGEIYGIDHTPDRFRLRWLKPATGIDGLYLTGQDIVTCGVAGALFGGVLTASAVLKKNLVVDIVKRARMKRAASKLQAVG